MNLYPLTEPWEPCSRKSGLEAGEIRAAQSYSPGYDKKYPQNVYRRRLSDSVCNTFGANRYKLEDCGHSVDEVIGTGIAIAKKACAESGKRSICGSLISGLSVSCWSLRKPLPLRKHTTFFQGADAGRKRTLTLSSSRP